MSHTNTDETKKIPLGSGDVFIAEFTGGEIPDNATLETITNKLGYVVNGANITYKPTFYTAKSDDGKVSKKSLTGEDGTLDFGLITWNGNTLDKLISTATVSEISGNRKTKIGGAANYDGKKYIVRFVVTDPVDGDMRITVVGSNVNGITAAFQKDKEASLSPSFECEPIDSDGTLIIIDEEILTAAE